MLQDVETDEAEQEEAQSSPFTMMDLQEFMHDEMFTAVIEKEFVEGKQQSKPPAREAVQQNKQEQQQRSICFIRAHEHMHVFVNDWHFVDLLPHGQAGSSSSILQGIRASVSKKLSPACQQDRLDTIR